MRKIITKPWGYEIIWAQTENYVGKLIHINAGQRLSLQFHREKEETIYVSKGILHLEADGKSYKLFPEESFHLPPGMIHRFGANEDCVELIEVSTTQISDVVRIEDDFNRE